ncbi:MAG: tRNA pseudouridine(13) synthase TruD [Planctomycetota bacterium]
MMTSEGLAYLTEGVEGVGGELKQRPEDFVVQEEPLVEPSGEGDFLYLYVQKTKRITSDVVRLFSQHFCVAPESIGYAGLKDKHAITRQWLSIEHAKEERAMAFEDDHIQILGLDRHPVPLRRGGLRGNRFDIKIRAVAPGDVVRARAILDTLAQSGVPNFVGEQRFGYRNDGHLLGRLLLKGDDQGFLDSLLGKPMEIDRPLLRDARLAYEAGDYARAIELWPTSHRFERQAVGPLSRGAPAGDAVNGVDLQHRKLLVSALQSAVFNTVLDRRLRDGWFDRFVEGDVAFDHTTRKVIEVTGADGVAAAQARYEAGEWSPSGPMWGRDMQEAGGEVGRIEREALAGAEVTLSDFESSPYEAQGSRRAMRMLIEDTRISAGGDEYGPYIGVSFMLPRGCFATVVLREIMKS